MPVRTHALSRPMNLSSAWLFFLLTTVFRDIHNFVRPGFVEQVLTGVVNGHTVTDTLLLIGGVAVTLPIALVWLSPVLPDKMVRWASALVAVMNLAFVATTPLHAVDEIYFAVLHIGVLGFILWTVTLGWHSGAQAS